MAEFKTSDNGYCLTDKSTILLWQTTIPFLYNKPPNPSSMTNHHTLLLWQTIIPFFHDKPSYTSSMTNHHTLLLWQITIPFLYNKPSYVSFKCKHVCHMITKCLLLEGFREGKIKPLDIASVPIREVSIASLTNITISYLNTCAKWPLIITDSLWM